MERNDPCWCGSGKKYKKCHMPIEEKMQLHADRGEIVPSRKLLKTPFQIEKIKASAELNTKVLDAVAAGNAEEAKALLVIACKKIDQGAANRLFHKNCAARRKSRLARRVNSLSK